MKEALFWKMCPAVSEPLVSIPWCLSSFGCGLQLDRYNPSVSWVMLRNAAGASLGCRGTSGGSAGDEESWESEFEAVCVMGAWRFVTPSIPNLLKAPLGIPEIMKLTLKPCFVQKKSNFSLLSAILILQSACGNLSFQLFLFPQVFDQYSEMPNRSQQTV